MKSLFDACRADYVTRVFSPDQKEAISNYSNNVYKASLLRYIFLCYLVIKLKSQFFCLEQYSHDQKCAKQANFCFCGGKTYV